MAHETSVAPKERVNIVYKTASGEGQNEQELPFKLLVLGDFTQAEDQGSIDERDSINVTQDNFDSVLKSQKLKLNLLVDDTLNSEEGGKMPLTIELTSLEDFEPDRLIQKIEPLRQLMELRQALKTVKKTITGRPAFRQEVQALADNEELKARLLEELSRPSAKKP
jgi:type VI secretion system protein ImpB